jgi:hypothetical protein
VGKIKVKFAHYETNRYFGVADLNIYLATMFNDSGATHDIYWRWKNLTN